MIAIKDQSVIMPFNTKMKIITRLFVDLVVSIMLLSVFYSLPVAAHAALEGAGSGLVGWWKFDEGSGTTVADSSGTGNNGIIMGSPTWTTGYMGGGLFFDGITNFVRIPYNESLKLGVKTIAVWGNLGDFLKRYGAVTASFSAGTSVMLTPYPFISGMWDNFRSTFTGWSGSGCRGIGECSLLMDSDKAVTAAYGTPLPDPPVNLRIVQ